MCIFFNRLNNQQPADAPDTLMDASGKKTRYYYRYGCKAGVADFKYFTPCGKFYYYVLSGTNDNGEFSRQVWVNGTVPANGIAGGHANYQTLTMHETSSANAVKLSVPARSVVFMVVDKK